MSQGSDTPKTQIPKLKPKTIRNQNYTNPKSPKTKTDPKHKTTQHPKLLNTQNYTQIPKPKTQMFWVSFGVGTCLYAIFQTSL